MNDPVPVFEGEHLRAYLFPGHTGKMIVTFDFRKKDRTGFLPPNYSTGFARMGHSQLSIKTRENDWFINPDTPALEAAIAAAAARHDRTQMLGYSMGGYGALRFAKALKAANAVLVSPQVTIDRDLAPFETRFRPESERFDPVLGDIRPYGYAPMGGVVLIDPFVTWDLSHARMIKRLFPGLIVVRLAFAGHPATRLLNETGKIWMVQHAAVADRVAGKKIREAHRAGRRGSAAYWTRFAATADKRHPVWAAAARARAVALANGPEAAEEEG